MKTCNSCRIDYNDSKSICPKCGNPLNSKNPLTSINSARKLILDKKLKAEPNNKEVLELYCIYLYENESYSELTPIALKLIELAPDNHVALFGKAYSLLNNNQIEPAIDIFEQLLTRLSNNYLVQLYAAISLAIKSESAQAVDILTHLISPNKKNLTDLEKNRALLYYSFSQSRQRESVKGATIAFSKINFEVLKNNNSEFDYSICIQTILQAIKNGLEKLTELQEDSDIKKLQDVYLTKTQKYIPDKFNNQLAEAWQLVSEKQESLNLYEDAFASLLTAMQLSPDNSNYLIKKNELSEKLAKRKSSGHILKIIVGVVLLLVAGSLLSYFLYFKQKWIDDAAQRYYTVASSSIMRSTPIAGVDYNRIESLFYGTELIVYSRGSEWSNIKAHKKIGYISTDLILNKKDFLLMNSIFGDVETRDAIETVKCRLALLGYYKKYDYIGKMDDALRNEVFGLDNRLREVWQVYSKGKKIEPNTVIYPRVVNPNSKFTDFAVIIENQDTGIRKLLLFSFYDDQTPYLVYEELAPPYASLSKKSIKMKTVRGEVNFIVNYVFE